MGGTIIGFDQGFAGMKVGGQRRIFIPWQMGYGTRTMPDRGAGHPGIPAKSDLIFDVELVDVTEVPPPQARPGMRPGAGGQQMPPRPGAPSAPMQMTVAPKPAAAPAPGAAPNAPAPATPAAPSAPAAAPKPAAAPAPAATAPAVPPTSDQPPAK
jgi:peptidylprolyl isomerase